MAITTAGKAELVDLWGNLSSPTVYGYIAFGTGSTAADASDTTLETEVDREEATVEQISVLGPLDTIRFSYIFDYAAGGTIKEVGVFNDDTAGDMWGRYVLTNGVVIPTNGRAVVIYDFTFKDGGFSGGSGC